MYLNNEFIEPAELTGYVRAALQDLAVNRFTLSRWLPDQNIDDLEYRFMRGGEGLAEAATFRAYDAEAPIGSRPGFSRISGELPPISRKIRFGEYDRLRQRKASAEIVAQGLKSDAVRMTTSVAARAEVARGDALVNGSVTIAENGVFATVVFGRSGTHSVTAATPWSTIATATPLANLLAWIAVFRATNGVEPGAVVMSSQARGYLLQNAEIRSLAATTAGTPTMVSQSTVDATFAAYGLPPIVTYDAQVKIAGVATRIIPADKVLLLPGDSSDFGATLWGTTAESLEPEYGVVGDEPGIVAGVYKTPDPVAMWTKAAGIVLPVMANPDLSFVADVF